jgi:hypothetical protein
MMTVDVCSIAPSATSWWYFVVHVIEGTDIVQKNAGKRRDESRRNQQESGTRTVTAEKLAMPGAKSGVEASGSQA